MPQVSDIIVTVSMQESDLMDNGENRCAYHAGAMGSHVLLACTEPMLGKIVQLQLERRQSLQIAEVEIHGYAKT